MVNSKKRQLEAVRNTELGEYVADVAFNGVLDN